MGVQSLTRSAPGSDKRLILGRDADGNWVVCDERGLVGGLFADRGTAVHIALFESEFAPAAVVCIPEGTVLNLQAISEDDDKPPHH